MSRYIALLAVCLATIGCESRPSPPTVKNAYEVAFDEGKDAGRAGLSRDLCPYPPPEQKSGWYVAESGERRSKWLSGHNAGTIEREAAK